MNALFAAKVRRWRRWRRWCCCRALRRQAYIDAIGAFGCTALTSVPTMIARVVKEEARLAAARLGSVRRVQMGSAPQTQALWDKARQAFPGARIVMGYGTTEHGPSTFGPHPAGIPTPDLALGYPLPGQRGAPGRRRHARTKGVLEVRCPAVMEGYLNLPEVTAAVLRDGWYRTGDLVRRDADGFYFFVGRADDMFVCSGENIYPGEVEGMLERHPAVHQASVVPVADDERGQIPVAFVVLRPGAAASEDEIKALALANAMPVQHPRRVWFEPELPLTGTNKIDRRALIDGGDAQDFGSSGLKVGRLPIHSTVASPASAGSDRSGASTWALCSASFSCGSLGRRRRRRYARPARGRGHPLSVGISLRLIWLPSICQPTINRAVASSLP